MVLFISILATVLIFGMLYSCFQLWRGEKELSHLESVIENRRYKASDPLAYDKYLEDIKENKNNGT
jgi:hypothetical protein